MPVELLVLVILYNNANKAFPKSFTIVIKITVILHSYYERGAMTWNKMTSHSSGANLVGKRGSRAPVEPPKLKKKKHYRP